MLEGHAVAFRRRPRRTPMGKGYGVRRGPRRPNRHRRRLGGKNGPSPSRLVQEGSAAVLRMPGGRPLPGGGAVTAGWRLRSSGALPRRSGRPARVCSQAFASGAGPSHGDGRPAPGPPVGAEDCPHHATWAYSWIGSITRRSPTFTRSAVRSSVDHPPPGGTAAASVNDRRSSGHSFPGVLRPLSTGMGARFVARRDPPVRSCWCQKVDRGC